MMNPNKFNIGDKVWFKLDSYGKKAERCGTICSSILCDPTSGWQYNIETGDHKHWNIPEKDINYTAPHIRERDKEHVEESVTDFLNRIYGNPDFKPEVHSDAADSLAYSIKRKLDGIRSNAVYGLNTDLTFYDEFVNKEDNKMKNQQQKRNRNIIKTEKYQRTIKDITFNGPAVIIKFEPSEEDLAWGRFKGDKVVVVCKDGDKYDMKTGFLLAILKEFLNNQSYGNILEKLDSFDTFDIPQVGKECKYERKPDTDWDISEVVNSLSKKERKKLYYELGKAAREAVEGTDFKFEVGDIVRLKAGASLYKVVKRYDKQFGSRMVRYYRLKSNSPSEYLTTEREERLVLAEGY